MKVILIGGGIMSATLAMLLRELDPDIPIDLYEKLPHVADESSDAWNNAGTGHSAFCELNYTPQRPDGSIDISKALKIAEAFEVSKQFWAYCLQHHHLTIPSSFINKVPHLSCVWGASNIDFLKRRFEALREHPLFSEMRYSDDREQLLSWMPLMMKGRDPSQKMAATYMPAGTDVNFGALTRMMLKDLQQRNVRVFTEHEVKKIRRSARAWELTIKDLSSGERIKRNADFVFIGAGGAALTLLERSGIREGNGFGGFPVSGQWLICKNSNVIKQHSVKVYGQAAVGTPPMSVPHLDSRFIHGKKELLFGPFAGFNTKFLKHGSFLDLIKSIRFSNIIPMIAAGLHNIPLTKYLFKQVQQSDEDRLAALKIFVPTAKLQDWELAHAGQRVQIIKKDDKAGGVLQFGTELVTSGDGSLAALLGASPGASVAVSIMLDLLDKCFHNKMQSPSWKNKLKEMVPGMFETMQEKKNSYLSQRTRTSAILGLSPANVPL